MRIVRRLSRPLLICVILLLSKHYAHGSQVPPSAESSGLDCAQCHMESSWTELRRPLLFDHQATAFPLEGQHRNVDCRACHRGSSWEQIHAFSSVQTRCVACHEDVHRGTLGVQCDRCHTPVDWVDQEPLRRMHETTRFPLVGVHASLDCQACHSEGKYAGMAIECSSCHWQDYLATRNPDHRAVGFGSDCQTCHGLVTTGWRDNITGYSRVHPFPLVGGHALESCDACHIPGSSFSDLSSACVSCHLAKYQSTTDPDHEAAHFGTICNVCHTVYTWSDAHFDHQATGFPLTGVHASLECNACHTSGYEGLSAACVSCHRAEYDQTANPPHLASAFPLTCELCHTTTAWTPATFDHAQSTGFALTGAHASLLCSDCHQDGNFANTPNECLGCHQAAFEEATNPPHDPLSFGTDCAVCHTTTAWSPATFDHATVTGWALTGAHRTVACTACHGDGYFNTPTDCYSCHQADYNGTTDPDHAAAGFPTTCEDCHSTAIWDDATFDHDGQYFPIYSGTHRGTWTSCSICHPNPASYADFSCLKCHEHNQATTDAEHREVRNYRYDSQACYECHRRGVAEDDSIRPIPRKPKRGLK